MSSNEPPPQTSPSDTSTQVTYRTYRPGDLGYLIHRQATLYHTELHCADPRLECASAQAVVDFLSNGDKSRQQCWIAERDGRFAGSIILFPDPESKGQSKDESKDDSTEPRGIAKIRLFFVEEHARGMGVGKHLLSLAISFAKEAGYKSIRIHTDVGRKVARNMYEKAGFQFVKNYPEIKFDFEETAEMWEKVL